MDIARPRKRHRFVRGMLGACVLGVLGLGAAYFTGLRVRPPSVDIGAVMLDTVKRGTMLREVRGSGVLTPEQIRWVAAATEARVDRILIEPGVAVTADTVVVELNNPQLERELFTAEWAVRSAEADLTTTQVQVQNELLDREEAAAQAAADLEEAELKASANLKLQADGLVSTMELQLSQRRVELKRLTSRIAQERVGIYKSSQEARLASVKAKHEQAKAEFAFRQKQAENLKVRAGIDGILQSVAVEPGQRVLAGATLAKVARPDKLKAVIKVAETEVRDVSVGQPVSLDLRGAVLDGKVMRIDPAVQQGTVTVDVGITGALPRGARPDLAVFAKIEVERLEDVVYVSRPASARADSSTNVFRLSSEGRARKVAVQFGAASAASIVVVKGLEAGEQVIVSDMSAWDGVDEVEIR